MSTSDASVRARLLERRRALLRRYRDELERVEEELAAQQAEVVERSSEQWDARVLSSLGDTDVRAIVAVVEALARLDSGTYGRCVTCELPIGAARLDVLAEAALCIDCASADADPPTHSAVRTWA
jgi:DnaK suppressor protein